MLIIDAGTYNPWFNIASEEFLFRNFSEEIFLVYINNESVIAGKHQNIYEEVNLRYVMENRIPVIRRISGGGTVYHDRGNLNFTFIKNLEPGKPVNYKRFSDPVMDFLREEGINPEAGEKNEVREAGLKFSGNAEHVFRNRALHHGTILFSASLKKLHDTLHTEPGKYSSRAITSNRTSVGNIGDKLGIESTEDLKSGLVKWIRRRFGCEEKTSFPEQEIKAIKSLVKEKYSTWDWNWGYGPKYRFANSVLISGEKAAVTFHVSKGRIVKCTIDSRFTTGTLQDSFIGKRHSPKEIQGVFNTEGIQLTEDELYSFF